MKTIHILKVIPKTKKKFHFQFKTRCQQQRMCTILSLLTKTVIISCMLLSLYYAALVCMEINIYFLIIFTVDVCAEMRSLQLTCHELKSLSREFESQTIIQDNDCNDFPNQTLGWLGQRGCQFMLWAMALLLTNHHFFRAYVLITLDGPRDGDYKSISTETLVVPQCKHCNFVVHQKTKL